MERRKFLSAVVFLAGGALSSSTLRAIEKTGPFPEGESGALQGHSKLDAIVDTILPASDTPGALEVGVTAFVAQFISQRLDTDDRESFLLGLKHFAQLYPDFHEKPVAAREAILIDLLAEGAEPKLVASSIARLHELTILGYYTSEAGASLELAYDPIPGPYRQVTIAEFGRTWAT